MGYPYLNFIIYKSSNILTNIVWGEWKITKNLLSAKSSPVPSSSRSLGNHSPPRHSVWRTERLLLEQIINNIYCLNKKMHQHVQYCFGQSINQSINQAIIYLCMNSSRRINQNPILIYELHTMTWKTHLWRGNSSKHIIVIKFVYKLYHVIQGRGAKS